MPANPPMAERVFGYSPKKIRLTGQIDRFCRKSVNGGKRNLRANLNRNNERTVSTLSRDWNGGEEVWSFQGLSAYLLGRACLRYPNFLRSYGMKPLPLPCRGISS